MSGGNGSNPRAAANAANAIAQRKAKEEEDARLAEIANKEKFNVDLGNAFSAAQGNLQDYFAGKGVDAGNYEEQIGSALSKIKNRVPEDTLNIEAFFNNAGEDIFNTIQNRERNILKRNVRDFTQPGYVTNLIDDAADDDILNNILTDRRGTAEQFIQNMLDRNVINQSGYAAAQRNLDEQGLAARISLEELGNTELNRGRSKLENIAGEAQNRANTYQLGDVFDPQNYQAKMDASVTDFFAGLAERIGGLAPQNLFVTSGLPNVAGQAQGAGNTAFIPNLLQTPNDEEEYFNNLANRTNLQAF